jgi:four helix bundle protein
VPSNIAEGYGRGTTRDYVRFLWNANGSLAEVETQLLLAQALEFGHTDIMASTLEALAETERVLSALIRSLEEKVDR